MFMKKIKIKIDDREIECAAGMTIMAAAEKSGIFIPGLCGHPDFSPKANCRVCVVEVYSAANSGQAPRGKLVTSCSTHAQDGMVVRTDAERVKRSRNLNIELLFAEHIEKCPTCVWRFNCKLLELAERYKILITVFKDRKRERKIYKFANAVEIDGTQCIDCRNCVDACSKLQKINYLELKGKGIDQEVVPVKNKKSVFAAAFANAPADKVDCIYCGQCALHCPVGAAQEQTDWEAVEKEIKNVGKVVVAQFAPSVAVSMGEEFGIDAGKITTGQVIEGLRKIGFNHVFDASGAADLTAMIEAEELLERLKKRRHLPMFTSCCPAWVKYAEFYRPDLIPNLASSRSPQIHAGGVIKTYWAEKTGISPKNIVVVSIMPCPAKKFEAAREELRVNGLRPVDYVLTARELVFLFKKNKIDLAALPSGQSDDLFGEGSGAGVIYEGSGGVIEAVLRTAADWMRKNGKIPRSCFELKNVRGSAGIKEAKLSIGGKDLRAAAISGIGEIAAVLADLKKYDYIEVRACPGGCVGGGGQPIPTTPAIRKKRADVLYKSAKSRGIKKAHENKNVIGVLKWLENKKGLKNKILFIKYRDYR